MCREAFEVDWREYIGLIERSIERIESERTGTEYLTIEGKLAKIASNREMLIISDLHGNLQSLLHILKGSRFIEKAERFKKMMILLGDYGDRGSFSPEVYYVLLKLKESLPLNILLMRGNHEGPDDLLAHPHDLPQSFKAKFDNEGLGVYSRIRDLFPELYNIVVVNNLYVLVHGGVPSQASTIDDLRYAHLNHPKERHLEEMLWSDPMEGIDGVHASPRGAGRLFGADVTESFLKMLHVKFLIRGHEPSEKGFKMNHNDKILTLFSRKGPPYSNSSGAYLHLAHSVKPKNVNELLAHVHQF
jgi:diadenosine tetraphosphatase ApaH/serine/threonine PP2A family protein phosphatase